MEPLEDLQRGRLVVEGDVVRHGHHEEALLCQELQQVAVGNLGDGADEGAAEELDDGERAAAARGREDEAEVLPQVRPPPGGHRPGGGERGQGAVGAKRRAAGEAPDSFGPVCVGATATAGERPWRETGCDG